MAKIVALRPAQRLACAEHGSALEAHAPQIDGYGGGWQDLLPEALVMELRHELDMACSETCDLADAARLAVELVSAYPSRAADTAASIERYLTIVTRELQTFPQFAAEPAVRLLQRRSRFMPSVAEIVSACEAEMEHPQSLHRGLSLMSATHNARRRQEDEQERVAERNRAWGRAKDAMALKLFGSEGVATGDFAAATLAFRYAPDIPPAETREFRTYRSAFFAWMSLTGGEEWGPQVLIALRRGAPAGRALLGLLFSELTIDEFEEVCASIGNCLPNPERQLPLWRLDPGDLPDVHPIRDLAGRIEAALRFLVPMLSGRP